MDLYRFILPVLLLVSIFHSANGQAGYTTSVSGDILTIRFPSVPQYESKKNGKSVYLRLSRFNFPSASCNKGFRLFLSYKKRPSLLVNSANYIGSFFMGHDCSTIFVIPLDAVIAQVSEARSDILRGTFTFQFIDSRANIIPNVNFLKTLHAEIIFR